MIAKCTKDSRKKFFTISFRSFSPVPLGIEFLPGQDYYFISTSSSDDLHNMEGGYCRTHNMKVVFKVSQTLAHRDASKASHTGRREQQGEVRREQGEGRREQGELRRQQGRESVRKSEAHDDGD